ncbi:MAG TPA: amino acid adenylation domain-containing protein [Candidatus Sulfotelmatobacter sp.]|nr:amino acid adenylation domain-containing protein [Candidatus Sulfotelmatobacter sp.]
MSRSAFPASFAQERLWFLDQFEPGSAAYNIPRVFRISGPLHADVLTKAFKAIVQRHPALRTIFDSIEGEARQVVLSSREVNIPIVDLGDLPQEEREATALRMAAEEGMKPFDLSEGPLLRLTLLRLDPETSMLVLVMHHIITDGWSISRLFRDVTKSYAAFLENKEPELPELPIQYAEYAQWQREYMSGEVLQEEVEHWRRTLAGAQTLLDLPTDHSRPAMQTWHGARKEITFSATTLAKLKTLAQKESATLFMVTMAAFQAMLWRYTQQESILVGTPIAARNHVEIEELVGLFVNTLIFRTDFTSDLSFRELIRRVRAYSLEAYMHQDVPFEKLVEELVPQRALDRPPLFQVMFIFQNIPKQIFEISGLTITEMNFETGIAKFDLSAEVWEDREFHCQFEYNTDLFEHSTIERMLGHFERLVLGAIENPDVPFAQLPMMNPQEHEQIVVEWNGTATELSRDQQPCVHELFELQAERSPDAIAVVARGTELTYRELDERANRLARYLTKRGVGPEVLVGLSLARDTDMVVALLGILKAGGAYVPLDPRVPDDRISFMMADAQPRIVITERSLQRPVFGPDQILLDSDWSLIAQESKERLENRSGPRTLAYVMYTSGSTGKPKGVPIEHGSVANLLRSMQREPGLTSDDALLAVTTLSFDIAGLEMYLPLISGARLVIASSEDVVDGNRLRNLLSEKAITFMQATPATWRLLLGAGWQGSPNLKILCGGEALPPELAKELTARAASVWNVYGPTETTIWSTVYRVTGREESAIPIGRPIDNTSIYILDSNLNPVPVNITGEIYIGGDGLARGYLNRPELTAERFVRHPWLEDKSAKLYRTGDLGRFRANGNIDYLGRVDNQVKLRGLRIELGEIESVLASHANIQEAVVIVAGEGEQRRLSAYVVVGDAQSAPSAGELRRYLRTKLPEHMVPGGYWRVERMPLLPNGKVNRGALASSLAIGLREEAEPVDPRNDAEQKLAEIWKELLQVEQVGIEQNFFELGGHSLLALQVTARIRRTFGLELPVKNVFETPTIAALALEVEKGRGTGLKSRTRIPRRGHHAVSGAAKREAFPASFAQERLWFLDQFEPGTGTYNMPCVFRISGPLNVDALTRAFRAVVQRHASLRTVFDSVNGEARQVVLPDLEVKVPVIDLTEVPEGERESEALRLASEEGKKPFDLQEGPLLRTVLVRLDPETFILLIVMHHIISDGWSISRLFHDVTKCYAAFLNNADPELPELPIEYTDYAQWQREYMSGEVLSKEVEYWEKTLAGAQTVLDLATDHPRPAAQTWNGARKEITLDVATLGKMKAMAQSEMATLYMVSMAAFQALLWRYTHQESILVGTPTGARNDVELEEMIGLFVNTLVFRADFTSNLTFRDLIRQVRSYALEAYMHQDLPFEKLVEELVPQRSLDTPPLFQAMFIFQNIPPQVFEISGLSIRQMSFETGVAKFDLSAELWEDTELHCQFEYNTDLFEPSSIQRMLGNFETLIQAALANPDLPLAQLPILSAREREQILVEWNRTTTDYSRAHPQPCIHELFESQVEQSPDAVAVISGEQKLTYRELNQQANQLAWHLLRGGVGPEVPVCMSLDRGPGMMVALLGILKAGGAYVPLDPRLPDDRMSFMLADVKPRMVLTDQKMQRGVFGTGTVLLDRDWDVIAQESTENPNQKLSSDSLAYVMFTSGSTGRPKGVLIEHGSVVNLLRSMRREPGITREDVLLALAIISFDMATPEMYLPLISGARMVIGSLEDAVDGNRLRELMSKQGVTFMQATPATCRLLLAAGWQGSPDLKLLCGAEAVPAKLALELIPRCKSVWNVYGPTETTVWSTVYRATGQEKGSIPIGRPIANTSIYILDSNRNPVPVNVAGEIYIGGDGLARGYLNRPELEAERFVANPLSTNPTSKLYRTGDLGRFRFNGEIEYLGRVDNQVKLRGFRIELGEIESVLASHPALQEAVVNITGEAEQQKLSAYVVVNDGKEAPSASELRRHLRAKLPEYMVPSGYWRVEKMPLGATGKVDRAALAGLTATALREEAELVAPRNETEAKLAEIWRELLQVEQLGIEQNFFELGGHSLLALQMMARIRYSFEVELQVRSLFEAPTIAALALELEKARATGQRARMPIAQHRPPARSVDATREALLLELSKLSVDEAKKFIERAVGRKSQI